MKISSLEAVRQHLVKESKNGSPTAILVTQIALFVTFLFLHKTTFISKHDPNGIISVLSYQIVALLLPYSKHLSQLKVLPRSWGGLNVNLVMNWVFLLLLAIPIENYYEKSEGSLGVVLSTAVLVLALRVIIRPRNDFGVLGFLLGAAVSIACNLFRVGYKTWVVVAICFGLVGFRFLLVQNWLEVEDEGSAAAPIIISSRRTAQENKRISKSTITQALLVPGFYLYWDLDLLRRSNCWICAFSINSCPKTCLKGLAATCLNVLVLWFSITFALGLYHWLRSLVSSNKVDAADDRQKKGKIEEDKSESHRTSSDTLRRRHNNQSKVTASFKKILGDMDLKKNLIVEVFSVQAKPNNESPPLE